MGLYVLVMAAVPGIVRKRMGDSFEFRRRSVVSKRDMYSTD